MGAALSPFSPRSLPHDPDLVARQSLHSLLRLGVPDREGGGSGEVSVVGWPRLVVAMVVVVAEVVVGEVVVVVVVVERCVSGVVSTGMDILQWWRRPCRPPSPEALR